MERGKMLGRQTELPEQVAVGSNSYRWLLSRAFVAWLAVLLIFMSAPAAANCDITPEDLVGMSGDEVVTAFMMNNDCEGLDLWLMVRDGSIDTTDWMPPQEEELAPLEHRIVAYEHEVLSLSGLDCQELFSLASKGISLTREALGRASTGNSTYWGMWAARAYTASEKVVDASRAKGCPEFL